MNKFKLELSKKTPDDKVVMGATHINAMTGNTHYPQATRVPSDAQVQPAQDELKTAVEEADAAETTWKQKILVRDQKEAAWDTVITARANNCEAVTPEDLAALTSTSLPLRTSATPMGALTAPGDLRAVAAAGEATINLRCNPVAGARSYEWQCRLHDGSPPWGNLKTSTTTKITAENLTPGVLYGFRVRAIGSAGPGDWSDEAVERAP